MKARLKQTLKACGRTAAVFHSSVFLATLSGSYAAIRYGVDLDRVLARVPFVDVSKFDPEAGTLALAYVSTLATGAFYRSPFLSMPLFWCNMG